MQFSEELLSFFEAIGKKQEYKKNAILFYEGQKPKDLYLLLKGCVRLYKTDEAGLVINIHFLQSPSFIAEMPVFEGLLYPASASFESDSVVLKIDFQKFKEKLFKHQEICMLFIKSLMFKIKFLEYSINQNFTMSVRLRFIKFIIGRKTELENFTQKEIARFINTTPETLSRTIKKLKEERLIDTCSGKIKILDLEALKQCL